MYSAPNTIFAHWAWIGAKVGIETGKVYKKECLKDGQEEIKHVADSTLSNCPIYPLKYAQNMPECFVPQRQFLVLS